MYKNAFNTMIFTCNLTRILLIINIENINKNINKNVETNNKIKN